MNQMLANKEYEKAAQDSRRLYKRNVKSWENGMSHFNTATMLTRFTGIYLFARLGKLEVSR